MNREKEHRPQLAFFSWEFFVVVVDLRRVKRAVAHWVKLGIDLIKDANEGDGWRT